MTEIMAFDPKMGLSLPEIARKMINLGRLNGKILS